jgi:3-hydroxybutyryl-CoA dehydrogenase
MQIAVLASGVLKEEFLSKKIPSTVDLLIVESLSGLLDIRKADAYFDCEFVMNSERIQQMSTLLPKPVFINSVTHTLSDIDRPFIRMNAWPTCLKRNISEIAAAGDQQMITGDILGQMGWSYQLVPDIAGMISARIIAMIVNEAYYTFQDNISTKKDIDIAMKLGTNYPYGPFEWSEKIGLKNIHELLERLGKTDSRYTISTRMEEEINS